MLIIARTILPPVLVMIGLGMLLDRCWRMDLPTLSKITFAIFVPALVLEKILTSNLDWGGMAAIGTFALLHVVAMGCCTLPLWLMRGPTPWRDQAPVISLGAMFFNAGNIGLPVAALAFGEAGLGVMAIVLMVQNLTSFTGGILLLDGHRAGLKTALVGLWRIPVVYAILLALAMRALGWSLPESLMVPVGYLSDGLIPVALVTLGVQFGRCSITGRLPAVSLAVGMRLVISPLIAAALLWTLPLAMDPTTRAICLCAAGMPVATNVFIIATEYDKGAELASRMVFWSTALSAISLPIIIAWCQ